MIHESALYSKSTGTVHTYRGFSIRSTSFSGNAPFSATSGLSNRVLLRFTFAFAGMPSLFECIDLRKQMDQNADIVEKLSRQVTLHRLRRRINSKPRAHYILHASRDSYCLHRHLALSPALLSLRLDAFASPQYVKQTEQGWQCAACKMFLVGGDARSALHAKLRSR